MSILEKNLHALTSINPPLKEKLSHFETNTIYEIFLPENSDEENLNLIDTRDNTPLYESTAKAAIKANIKEFKKFDFYPMLYCFGIGNGYFYKKLLQNPRHQSIMILEPELELLYITLSFVDFSQEILEGRIYIEHTKVIDQNYCISFLNNRSKFFLKVYDLHIHSSYYEKFIEDIKLVHSSFVRAFKQHAFTMGNSADDGIIGLEKSLHNTTSMLEKPTLQELLKKGANSKTAIIVSTGPSLAKQLPLLKKMQNYVTILCIDASFPILSNEGIKPDIVFSIERVEETSKFYEKTDKKYHKDVIFALASVIHAKTVEHVHGEINFFLRGDSYNRYFELNPWGYLGGGMSAANFAYDFARSSKFEEIVIIGQDLAYGEDGSSHAKNHIFGEDEISSKDIYCEIPSYGGKTLIPTTRVWKSFLDSYEFQIRHSQITTINATEGGARIEGALEKSFQSVCDEVLEKKEMKHKIITKPLPQKQIEEIRDNYHDKLKKAITLGKKMEKKSDKAYKKAALFLERIKHYSDDKILKQVSFKELALYVDKITKLKEESNKREFANMYTLLLQSYVYNIEFLVAEVYVMRENNNLVKKKKKIAWIQVHQVWMARIEVNLQGIIKILEKEEEKLAKEVLEIA